MKRRDFNRSAVVAALGMAASRGQRGYGSELRQEFDRFGGWKGKQFQASGFFRVEKEDRWWLVSPEGNAYLSWGINHLYPDLFQLEYNQQAWQEKLGLERLQGPAFNIALRKWFLGVCERFGFNTVGVHNQLQIVNEPNPEIAYMQPIRFIDIPHWKTEVPDANFWDVFSPEFAQYCDQLAKQIALPKKDDPFLLGYSMTDCAMFTEEDLRERTDVIGGKRRESRIGFPRRLRNLPGTASGKQAFVKTMRQLYRERIDEFNVTYGTAFESFDDLARAENWRTQTRLSNASESRDNTVFLQRCVEKYYQTALEAIRRYDPNHLFVGDKINANTDSLDTVLPITSQYTDIVFYQMYARYEVQRPGLDRWSEMVDKPFINGDSAFTMITDTMPRPYGPVADDLVQRADWTAEFFLRAFERPEFVGWHYCGLIDASNLVPRKQARQHSGLLDGYGNSYPTLEKKIRACADEMYQIATG